MESATPSGVRSAAEVNGGPLVQVIVSGYGVMTGGLLPHMASVPDWNVGVVSRHLVQSPLAGVDLLREDDLSEQAPDVILGCFESDDRSREWWTSRHLAEAVRGRSVLCAEMSTLSHAWAIRWHETIGELGSASLEMPVTGSKRGAQNASLSVFVHEQGHHVLTDHLLSVIGDKRYNFTKPGHPTLFKLVYNAWGASILQTLQAYLPALLTLGPDFNVARTIVETDGWMSLVCASKMGRVMEGNFDSPDFAIRHMVKDLRHARAVLGDNRTLDLAIDAFEEAQECSGADADFTAVASTRM